GGAGESLYHTRAFAQRARQCDLLADSIEVGDVHQLRGLVGDGARESGMRVAEGIHGDAGNTVEVALAAIIDQETTLSVGETDVGTAVVVDQGAGFAHRSLQASLAGGLVRPKTQKGSQGRLRKGAF